MQKYLVCEDSLRFARNFPALLGLLAFFLHNQWLILATAILMLPGTISVKYNPFYQLHFLFLRRVWKKKSEFLEKDSGEIRFAWSLATAFFLLAWLLLSLEKFIGLAWALVLATVLLMFLAGVAGICVASLMYALAKQFVKRK